MSDPLRTATAAQAPTTEAEREALIERLLLAGLDHYFEGRYEQAVNVWTRVAFLERGHGRARAYIERARGALAERQRQSEELLHKGVEAYERGDLQAARDLLTRAIADGGANETALVFLQRLGRLETGMLPAPSPRFDASGRTRRTVSRPATPGERTNWFTTIVVSVVLAASILLLAQPVASWLGELPISAPPTKSPSVEALPIVRASETRMARARELYDSGRLRDALRLLEEIDLADPLRPEADRLKADVQRGLLSTAGDTTAVSGGETPR
jgi:tetratricopeptide (TPR) repeat protein